MTAAEDTNPEQQLGWEGESGHLSKLNPLHDSDLNIPCRHIQCLDYEFIYYHLV